MSLKSMKFLATSFPLVLLLSGFAHGNTCNNFANYMCAQSTPNTVRILGQKPTNSSVGTTGGLITGNSFGVQMTGGGSATDIIVIAAFTSSISGNLNGQAFTSIKSFPEGGALGAIGTTLQAMGLPGSPTLFGYVDLHTSLGPNGTLLVNMSGLPAGTAIYAMALNPVTTCTHGRHGVTSCTTNMQITNITPNSEAGLTGVVVPEPGTISLFGTGLFALAGFARRRLLG